MIAQIKDMTIGMEGDLRISLSVPRAHTDELKALQGEQLDFEVKKHREKRSLNANGFAWVLIGKIAERMTPPLSKEDVYFEMLKRYGQGTAISVLTSKLDDVKRELDYCEEIGTGIVNGKEFTHLRIWIGSSKYNSKEMAAFIDGIVGEAKELGIDTATPDELLKLTEQCERRYG